MRNFLIIIIIAIEFGMASSKLSLNFRIVENFLK